MDEWIDRIICGHAPDIMAEMPDEIVQTCITSPPYWGLRDYGLEPVAWDGDPECEHEWGSKHPEFHKGQVAQTKWQGVDAVAKGGNAKSGQFCDKCGAWLGTLGLEPSPELYIEHLVQIFREVRRVLRKDGTCWINIGDSYAGSWGNHKEHHNSNPDIPRRGHPQYGKDEGWCPQATPYKYGLKPKDMVLIPFRLALALQSDGWWIRSDIIWHKPNCMPSSVRDRPTTDFEHVFLLAKSKRYYYDQDAIREPYTEPMDRWGGPSKKLSDSLQDGSPYESAHRKREMRPNGSGRNRRTVWKIPTRPFPGAHFATFPPKLIEPMILAGSSDKACPHCGAAWMRISSKTTTFESGSGKAGRTPEQVNESGKWRGKQYGKNIKLGPVLHVKTIGFQPSCDCPDNDGSGASIVLDPFAGSGTTCAEAKRLRRHYVGIEAQAEYIPLAEKRIADVEVEMADAASQLDMFRDTQHHNERKRYEKTNAEGEAISRG